MSKTLMVTSVTLSPEVVESMNLLQMSKYIQNVFNGMVEKTTPALNEALAVDIRTLCEGSKMVDVQISIVLDLDNYAQEA